MDKVELIKKAKNAYYNIGEPIMSDAEYDKLVAEVGEETVGAPVLDSLKKINISGKPMLSLDKCHTAEEIVEFAQDQDLVASVKCDGLSVRIVYEDGKLISANTRGDGEVGQDISEHIKQFKNVPLMINMKGRLVVDGEAVILKKDFDEININNEFKNPRNLAAGTLASLDTSLCKKRKMSFIAWDLIENSEEDFLLYSLQLIALTQLGFDTVPWKDEQSKIENINFTNEYCLKRAEEKGIPCDGVVWKYNFINYNTSRTAHHFLNAIAWKPAITEVETELIKIEYDVSRTGQLTPVAVFKPIDLLGSTVERASLHNLSVMEEILGKCPDMDQPIWVFKANEIIPQISRSIKNDIPHDHCINIPNYCPICFGDTEVRTSDAGVKILYCANPNCEGKLAQQIDHFVGKKGLDVKGLSRATIEKLIDWGWINSRADVFKLSDKQKDWESKAGFGRKSVQNIITAIEGAKNTNFSAYISSLGIPLIGQAVSKQLHSVFREGYYEFREAIRNGYDFSNLEGFGPEMNKALHDYDYAEADLIAAQYLSFEQPEVQVSAPKAGAAAGLTFAITGTLSRPRAQIQADIEKAGAKMGSSVTSKTNYLVCNKEESSTKYNKAKQLNIPIITEKELMEML